MNPELASICLEQDSPIRQAIACIGRGQKGIVLVVDSNGRLIDTVVDGDVRRAILSGVNLDGPLSHIVRDKTNRNAPAPVTAPLGAGQAELLSLMKKHSVRQIPLLDDEGRVADLKAWGDFLDEEKELPLKAVIMAGGQGLRMRPLTEDTPKPMLPVGDRPLMERIIGQLGQVGIRRVCVATHYLAEKIKDPIGDGSRLGVEVSYLNEESPLGTAGALSLLDGPAEPLLIMNGDILTNLDFRAMLDFHRQQRALLTVGVRKYDVNVPYGVVNTEGPLIKGLDEKPVLSFFVNAGIYLMEPAAREYLEQNGPCDMTDVIERLLAAEERVASFPILEYWLDIGSPSDYERAQRDLLTNHLDD